MNTNSSKFSSGILSRFFYNQKGTVAVQFAIAAIVLFAAVGSAVDYSLMSSSHSKLQEAADAAVLAAAVSGESDQAELQKIATNIGQAHGLPDAQFKLTKTPNNTLQVVGSEKHIYLIMGMFKYKDPTIEAVAEASLGKEVKTDIALVLDLTQSMAGSRVAALKRASAELIKALKENQNAKKDNIQVSLVPFADYVRINPVAKNGKRPWWVKVQPDQETTVKNPDGSEAGKWSDCLVDESKQWQAINCAMKWEPETATKTWVGCMGSRKKGYATIPDFHNRWFQGFVTLGACNDQYNILEPLTKDLDKIQTRINGLNTIGDTYIPAGLMWGWRTIHPDIPWVTPSYFGKEDPQKVMVLMTDGLNAVAYSQMPAGGKDGYHGDLHGYIRTGSDRQFANKVTSQVCESIKEDGIRLITVALEAKDYLSKKMLKECASSSSDYYEASNETQLIEAFKDIGRSSLHYARLVR